MLCYERGMTVSWHTYNRLWKNNLFVTKKWVFLKIPLNLQKQVITLSSHSMFSLIVYRLVHRYCTYHTGNFSNAIYRNILSFHILQHSPLILQEDSTCGYLTTLLIQPAHSKKKSTKLVHKKQFQHYEKPQLVRFFMSKFYCIICNKHISIWNHHNAATDILERGIQLWRHSMFQLR